MKTRRRRGLFIACILIIVAIAFIGYYFIDNYDKGNIIDDAVPSELPDDEMIIVSAPVPEDKNESVVDKIFDRLGIESIDDDEIPLSGSSYNARDVGMIPNDKNSALHNANLLIRTLNVHSKIVIDDRYYITTPTESLTAKEVEIEGTADGEILSDNEYSSMLFDPALLKGITVKNVRFTNLNNSSAFLIIYNDKKINNKVDRVDIQDCTFTGNISLYRQYGNKDNDPDQIDFGVGNFIFRDNTVTNTKFSFIVLVNIPIKYCEVVGNSIKNFTYMFLNISISNDGKYSDKLFRHVSYLKVEDNIVVCDDDWWGETSSGSYYTFVLFEGDEVLYNNNHVEGMKTLKDFAVYDAYLSAHIVNYTNNTWKNNICFAPGKINNTLLKSKGGGAAPLNRNYTGNKFILEESFAERVGQSKDNLYVYFMSLTQYAETYNISDNLFDVYELRFPASSMIVSNFSFMRNTVRSKRTSGNLVALRVNGGHDVNSINISDNIFDLGEKADQSFNLIKMVNANSDRAGSIGMIKVINNNVSAPLGYLLYEVSVDDITFTGNTIEITSSQYPGFAYKGRFTKSDITDNNIVSKNSVTFYEGRQIYGEGTKKETLNISRSNLVSGDNGMHLDLNYSSNTPTTYKRSYTFTTHEGTHEFYFTFTLSYNPALKCAQVTFNNTSGETGTYRLGGSDTSSNGHGQFIELIGQNGADKEQIPFKVRFFNNKDSAGFYIAEYSSNYSDLKIETVSYESLDHSNV